MLYFKCKNARHPIKDIAQKYYNVLIFKYLSPPYCIGRVQNNYDGIDALFKFKQTCPFIQGKSKKRFKSLTTN